MSTEFKVSTKIIFWGDQLQPSFLIKEMELDQEFCKLQLLGEEILRKNGESTGGTAKTSRLSFAHNYQFPDDSRNPEKQFNFILNKLKNVKKHLNEGFNVDAAELQISLYYSEPLEGEVDFFIPRELQAELVKHNIDIRITALP